jgi:putative restriction endonuclease
MAFDRHADARVRSAVFEWLTSQVEEHGDVLPRQVLAQGLTLDGQRIPLLGPQGIFKPRVLDLPLSLTTAPRGPYDDWFGEDELLRYRYRGTDPSHPDNRGLRFAHQARIPLVYFHGLVPGRYLATWPVFIVGDDPGNLQFTVAVDDAEHVGLSDDPSVVRESSEVARREYVTSLTHRRLHQRAFRERVLDAYRRECAFCRFRHEELLDAAHIVADADPLGEPRISNGLALCRLHHAAFDRYFVGVRPDLKIEVRSDLLTETDGPTLVHGIQALHGQRISVPRASVHRPDPERLELRFEEFLKRAKAS